MVLENKQELKPDTPQTKPPLFIVGPPRCGSTYLYQLLINVFGFSYLSNLHCYFYGAPWIVEKYLSALIYNHEIEYKSNHGLTEGLAGPSECAEYWYRFFPRKSHAVSAQFKDDKAAENFCRSLNLLATYSKTSILFKNLYNSFRIDAIREARPDARFIILYRNPVDIGHSILNQRLKQNGNYNRWWSVPVPGINRIQSMPPEKQVLEQISAIYNAIDQSKQNVNNQYFHPIKFAHILTKPEETLLKLKQFIDNFNIEFTFNKSYIPTPQSLTRKVNINHKIYEALQVKSLDYNLKGYD